MKLFKINYKYFPSGAESSIIFAESEKEALSFAKDESDEKIENIEEIKTEKGMVYVGYFCC